MEPLKKPSRLPDVIPSDGPTVRVTETLVESDGGTFTLTLGEYRPVSRYAVNERHADDNSAYVEIARFALSPMTLQALKASIADAERYHEAHFGELPNFIEHKARLNEEVGGIFAVPEPEPRLGLRSA
jgi:hypothetical protein